MLKGKNGLIMKRLFLLKAKNGLITSGEVNEARWPHTCSRPCAFDIYIYIFLNTTKFAPPKTHHETHSSPATGFNSRRHARKHAPRVSPYSPASIDPEIVEIGLAHLSQSVKTTNVTHADTPTD